MIEGKWQGKVQESILVLLHICHATDHFVHLNTDQSGNNCSGRGDGRDDLAGNEFGFVLVSAGDTIAGCSQVGACCDEVYVKVLVVVLKGW